MASTYSTRIRLELQATGENDSTWGTKANTVFSLIDEARGGFLAKGVGGSSDVTLTALNSLSDESRQAVLEFTGVLTGNISVIVPTVEMWWFFKNSTSGAFTLTVKPVAGSGIVVTQGEEALLFCDGTDVVDLNMALSTRSIATGVGLSGGGDLTADRTLALDITNLSTATGATGDEIAIHNLVAGAPRKMTLGNLTGAIDINGTASATIVAADELLFYDINADANRKTTAQDIINLTVTATSFPAGTKMLFQQTAAPTGWTKDVTHNDKALRVTTGTAGSAGATAFTTVFGAVNTGSTVLAESELPVHSHGGSTLVVSTTSGHTHGPGSLSTNSTGSHTHSGVGLTTLTNGLHTHTLTTRMGAEDRDQFGGSTTSVADSAVDGPTNRTDVTSASTTGTHSHTIAGATASDGSHTHTISAGASATDGIHNHTITGSSGTTGAGAGHTHTMAIDVAYVDLIIATKD